MARVTCQIISALWRCISAPLVAELAADCSANKTPALPGCPGMISLGRAYRVTEFLADLGNLDSVPQAASWGSPHAVVKGEATRLGHLKKADPARVKRALFHPKILFLLSLTLSATSFLVRPRNPPNNRFCILEIVAGVYPKSRKHQIFQLRWPNPKPRALHGAMKSSASSMAL